MTDRIDGEGLAAVPLFAALPEAQLARLAESSSARSLGAGEWLFHQGDPGDALYVITAGSVDTIAERGAPTVVHTLRRGQCLGELALLTGEPRALGARARRDSELTVITRESFDALLLAEPGFGLALTHVLGGRLVSDLARTVARTPPPRIVGLLPLHPGAPVGAVADALSSAFTAIGSLARLDPREPPAPEVLDRLEENHDRVLLVATEAATDDAWTAYCLRQSDLVVGLASRPLGGRDSEVVRPLRGCDLAFIAPPGVEPDLERWMEALQPRTTHVLRTDGPAGARRMARRLSGRALGVVLSGGGARGLAHVGVIEVLQRAGYEVDRIGGTSIGGMVGSLFAEGRTADECMAIMEAEYARTSPLKGRTIPLVALSRGEKGFAAQQRIHGERRIEGLDVSFYCVSADLAAQGQVVHRRGLVAVAVSATQALPGFVPPVRVGDRMLVDGAILNNLPVDEMSASGEGPVVAVDVSGILPPPRPPRSRLPLVRRWIVGTAADYAPPIGETLLRSILLGNVATYVAARDRADVVIRPDLRGVSTMRFRDLEAIRRQGREAAEAALAAGLLDALDVGRQS